MWERRTTRTLYSRYSPHGCAERMGTWVAQGLAERLFGSRELTGRVDDEGFRLTVVSPYMRNSYRPEVRGVWFADGERTRIDLVWDSSLSSRVMMGAWLTFVGLFLCFALFEEARSRGAMPIGIVLVPLGMFALGFALPAFARWMARGEADAVLRRVQAALDATTT